MRKGNNRLQITVLLHLEPGRSWARFLNSYLKLFLRFFSKLSPEFLYTILRICGCSPSTFL
jgi:hypothetical protein